MRKTGKIVARQRAQLCCRTRPCSNRFQCMAAQPSATNKDPRPFTSTLGSAYCTDAGTRYQLNLLRLVCTTFRLLCGSCEHGGRSPHAACAGAYHRPHCKALREHETLAAEARQKGDSSNLCTTNVRKEGKKMLRRRFCKSPGVGSRAAVW